MFIYVLNEYLECQKQLTITECKLLSTLYLFIIIDVLLRVCVFCLNIVKKAPFVSVWRRNGE